MTRFHFSPMVLWALVGIVLGVIVVVVVVVALQADRLPCLQLTDGSELRVLKVEVGTNSVCFLEPKWRGPVRRILPDRWERSLLGSDPNQRFRTLHDSLLVWVDCRPPPGQSVQSGIARVRITGTDRSEFSSIPPSLAPGTRCLEFRVYPRGAKKLSLLIWDGAKDLPIELPNPCPVRPAVWTSVGIPQTNTFSNSDIILQSLSSFRNSEPSVIRPRFRVRSNPSGNAGWVEWRITALDRWGNWSAAGWPLRTPSPQFVWFPSEAGTWSLLAEGVEYISAGFVHPLTNGVAFPVAVGDRALLFGVRSLVAVGPGDYRIENGIPSVQSRMVSTRSNSTLHAAGISSGAGWVVNLRATEPGVLCVSEGFGDVKARTRIHDGRNDYRITSTNAVVQLGGRRLHFQFFSRNIPPEEGPLEVEVYGSLPPATFYVQ